MTQPKHRQHLKIIFKANELSEIAVVKNFFTTATDGKEWRA